MGHRPRCRLLHIVRCNEFRPPQTRRHPGCLQQRKRSSGRDSERKPRMLTLGPRDIQHIGSQCFRHVNLICLRARLFDQ